MAPKVRRWAKVPEISSNCSAACATPAAFHDVGQSAPVGNGTRLYPLGGDAPAVTPIPGGRRRTDRRGVREAFQRRLARKTSLTNRVADFAAVQRGLNSYYAEFFPVPPEKLRPHQHPAAELVYVLSGTLAIHIVDEKYLLDARDSIHFDSTAPHAYRRAGRKPCSAIVVTVG